jgi:trehalose 6-phosphate synthase
MEPAAELLLANRAYLDHDRPPGVAGGDRPAAGGLVAAIRPAVAPWDGHSGTIWIGAGRGAHDRDFVDAQGCELIPTEAGPLRQCRLFFDAEAWAGHYTATSNAFLWPLLHLTDRPFPATVPYFPAPREPSRAEWRAYREVNAEFARLAFEQAPRLSCWVHDYQLALVPRLLRGMGFGGPIGYFLHTPFPSVTIAAPFLSSDGMALLHEVLEGLLGADLVGLQTEGDVRRLLEAAAHLLGATIEEGGLRHGGRRIRVGAYPVGIDADEIAGPAREAALPRRVAEFLVNGLPLVVGLERADFTKGIPERLRAVQAAYAEGARFNYAAFSSPTRAGVPGYDEFLQHVEEESALAAEAAAAAGCGFAQAQEAIPWSEVLALLREAAVVFTPSLADGMNLVPLQAVIAQSLRPAPGRGVILTGRGAGAAEVYGSIDDGLVVVDPLQPREMCEALIEALAGRPARIGDGLIAAVRNWSARRWATRYLTDLGGAR